MFLLPHNTEKTLDASRASFDKFISAARFLLTRLPQWVVPMWYSGQPVFWLPHGLLPQSVEWLVAIPRAPMGSVSPATWQIACSITLGLLSESITSMVKPTGGQNAGQPHKSATGEATVSVDEELRPTADVPLDTRSKSEL